MSELDDLKAKVKLLGDVVLQSCKVETARSINEDKSSAGFEALFDIVRDLAEHEGISEGDFQNHYLLRYRYWLHQNLKRTEETSPGLAAEMDTRTQDELDF